MKQIEKILVLLFDYQRYEQNSALQNVIEDTVRRTDSGAVALDDNDLDSVAAAGETFKSEERN